MTKRTDIIIVLDAFKGSSVKQLNAELSGDNYFNDYGKLISTIIPPFSFEPDKAFLTGHYPEETDSGTHFWFSPQTSPFFNNKYLNIAEKFPHIFQLLVRRYLRWRLNSDNSFSHNIHSARIPFGFLPYFDMVNKTMPTEKNFSKYSTIFKLLDQNSENAVYLGSPVTSANAKDILSEVRDKSFNDISLLFLFAGDLDPIGHHYGPCSPEYKSTLKDMCVFIKHVINHVEKYCLSKPRVLIFGDHGMVKVERTINIVKQLKHLSVKVLKDYIYFLDSTLARFWFFNENSKKEIHALLKYLDGGSIITDEERADYHINYTHNKFGELTWWADKGTLILPNFWQDKKPDKGMHGYPKESKENHAGFLLFDSELKGSHILRKPLEMVDVFATIIHLFGITKPQDAHGVSAYKMIDK